MIAQTEKQLFDMSEILPPSSTNHRMGNLTGQLKEVMHTFAVNDVSEVYSPPRAVRFANESNLKPGWSLDLTTCDETEDHEDESKGKVGM